ncbi:diaminopimelate decarboxylase [Niabella sp. W65]|jgi:diaminopimelate decarboxylase|nr:diaminopimelate decarboxylase [Niabella sp. W65]MCH7366584.1 diaminopimelate decarboxylase [Niabella sp. W65]ULT42296.1 diaminopimelate decarboxylase [Niabella sp. I65]
MGNELSLTQLNDIAGQYGTPLYVYNGDKIAAQYKRLTAAFKSDKVRFFYACKSLTNINILKLLKAEGCNVDCSSINEVKLALYAGFEPQHILYTSNGIAFSEIEEAQSLGVIINIDSLSNLEKFGKKFGSSYPVGVRLRPNIMAGGNLKISTGHDKSKFGIPVDQLGELVNVVAQHQIQITNLHIHTGSDIKDPDVFVKGIEVLFDIIPHFPHLKSIDLGGGFKVAYKEDDPFINIEELAEKVLHTFDSNDLTKDLQIWFEPGKFLVSESGYFITQVNVLKETSATTFAGVNSGFNHLIRPMFYDAYHRIQNISNPGGAIKEYTVTGNICETDTFAWSRPLPEIREGDLLVFYNAGAYGFEMSSNYNSRFKPAEVLVEKGKPRLIRRRDVFEDLLKNQVL